MSHAIVVRIKCMISLKVLLHLRLSFYCSILLLSGNYSLFISSTDLSNFDYGFVDRGNKPSEISSTTLRSVDHGLCQKASQIWCFVRVLPFLIGQLEQIDDKF